MIKYEEITIPEELYFYMVNFKYGYLTKSGKIISEKNAICNEFWYNNYILQDTDDLIKTQTGNCFDQTEFARTWLKNNNYIVKTFHERVNDYPSLSHSFLIYKDFRYDNTYSWFETTWKDYEGIHSENTIEKLLERNYKEYERELQYRGVCTKKNISLIEFSAPKNHSTVKDYMDNLKKGKILTKKIGEQYGSRKNWKNYKEGSNRQ